MNWEEEVDKVAGIETPVAAVTTSPKAWVDRDMLNKLPVDKKYEEQTKKLQRQVDDQVLYDKVVKDKDLTVNNNTSESLFDTIDRVAGVKLTPSKKKVAVDESGLLYKIGKIANKLSGEQYPKEVYNPETAEATLEGVAAGATGATAWIPSGLYMAGQFFNPFDNPEGTVEGGIKHLERAAEKANKLRESLTFQPKSKGGKEAAEIFAKPFTWLAEKGHESEEYWLKEAEKATNEDDKKFYTAVGFLAGFGGEALPFIAPYGFKAAKGGVIDKWNEMPYRRRLQVIDAAEQVKVNLAEDKMTMAEVRKAWASGNEATREILRRRYIFAPKEDVVQPTTRPVERPVSTTEPIVTGQETPSTAPERAITFPTERAFAKDAPIAERVLPPPDRRPVAVSEPFKPGETPDPYTHKSDEVAPTGSAQAPTVPDSPAKFMVREELKKKLLDGSIKFPPRMEKTVEAASTTGDIDETAWMDLVDEAAGIKKEATIPAVFKTMHIDDLKGFAEKGVVGARAEIAKRKVANTTEPIIESEMSKSDIRSDEPTKKEVTKALTPSNYSPTDNIFNKPELKRNSTYAWRSMGESEFNKLMSGEKEYLGDKQASKGNFLAGIPESAGQFGGKGKYLVEFGGVKIAGDEGLTKGSKATVKNITKVWKFNDKASKWEELPVSKDTSGSFSVANPVFSKATSERSSSKKGKKEVVTLTPEQEKALVKKMAKALSKKGSKNTVIEKESIDAGANLTSIKERLLKDMLGYNPARTVTAELLQNALDATKENIGNITVDVVGNNLIMTDAGSGMTPEVAKNNLVRLGEHGTKGETDMGGFGLAKLPIMGWPDKFDIVTIADDVDGRYESHIWSTKEDYMNDHKVNFESEEVDSDPQTGLYAKDTGTKVTLTKDEFSRGSVRNIIANFANGLRTKHKITFINSEVGDPIVYEGTPLSEAKSKYEPIDLSFPGGTEVSIKFVDKGPYGWSEPYPITAHVYNKGLLLPDIPQYSSLSKFTLSRKPDFTIEVDFTRTPSASDTENYPFLVNRTRLNPSIENKIGAEIQHRVLDIESKITNLSQKSLKELFDNAPTVGGTKIIIPVDEVGIRENVAEVINTNKEAFQQLGALFSRYGRVLDTVPDTVPHTFAITTHSKVHGFRPKSGLLDKEYIVINPFSYLELSTTGSHKKFDDLFPNDLRKAATAIVDTLVHESAHINVPGHYADFVHEFHRINKEIGHKKLFSLEKEAQDVFTTFGEDITRATRNINELQREGTISDVFSDYTPESESQRVGKEGSGVYDRGIEEIGREAVEALKSLDSNNPDAIPYIEELGRKAYENGKRTWEDWSSEIKRVLGDLYDKFEDFMKAIYYTAERMWKDDRGVIGFDINGEKVVKPRIIRRSELSKLNRTISKHEKLREKIQDEVNELEGIGGKKSFERLKAIRLEKMAARLAKLKQERAINRAEMWSKAFEMLKEKEYASHIAKLKTSINRLDKTITRLQELADKTKDRIDVKAPKVSVEDAEFITSMPDLKGKWLGRIFENPIYTMEEWGRAFNKIASGEAKDGVTKIKELFYYPLRDAAHRADQHFANIHAQIEAKKKSLPKGASKRIMLYAYSKEKGGMDILKEMGYTEKDIPKLTPAEMDTLNWMYKGFEIFYDKINAARREAGMEQFGKVENYFTFGKDLSIAEILGFGVDDPRLMEFIHPKGTTFMSAKHRYGGMKRASLDAFNIFDMYMQTGTKHMYLSPEIARMRELLRKFDVENLNSDGSKYTTEWKASEQIPRAYSVLTDYLDFVAGKRKKLFPSSVEKGIQFLSTNITMATLSGNIRSAGIQPTAIHNTYVEIGPKYTAKGLEGLFTDMRYKAMQKSMVLFNREFDVSVKPTMSGAVGAIGKAREKINKSWIGMRALKELDMQTATATWIGAYKKALEFDKMTEKESVRYADDTVVKTQASAGRHDLAPIQRTAIGKFFTTFQTFVINNWNWLTKEVVGLKNESISNKKAVHKVVRYIIGAMLINTFYEDLLGVNSPLPAPIKAAHKAYVKAEEKNKKARSEETMVNPYSRAAWSAGLEFLQLVPGLGNARFGSSFLGAPAEYLSDVSGKVAAESGIYTGYEKSWLEILGKTVGMPGTTQASKVIRYFDKKEKEEEKERKGGGKLKGLEGLKGIKGLD